MTARTVLYTGKGGVGKTSVAAATARRTAAAGLRTLVLSTDAAHSLGDVLGTRVGATPTPVADRLDALQVDARAELTRHWGAVRAWAARGLLARGVDRVSAEELAVPPGLEELLSLLRVVAAREAGEHDVVVVDCAPTAETLRLVAFPEVAGWWLRRVAPRQDDLLGTAAPIARALLGVGLPDRDALADVTRAMRSLLRLREALVDDAGLTFRLVTTAERVVVDETRRTATALGLHGIPTDAVVVNRLFPDDVGAYFAAWRDRQATALAEIDAAFAPVPVLRAPYLDEEVVGAVALDRLGAALWTGVDPAARLHEGPGRELTVDGDEVRLRIAVPLVRREDVALRRVGDELVVEAGGHRRTVLMPAPVAHYRPAGAALRDGHLEVTLRAPEPAD
ncbi:ArsA family ATPase [Patulibacter sp. SYSU D01012]|uniref:ArsA family ATPase n=1 Tax=Patulibacter sp. SYSU D01012 TaxID=2817381 RepID=UPI001B30CB67|nr:ArsA family ATPase [Patulibacter sp. SYSU D01012]